MKWYQDLYLSENIADRAEKIKWKIRHRAGQLDIFVIALASNPKNLLDIIPARELLQRGYPTRELYIIGLSKGRDEAVDLSCGIVEEVYQATGGFDIRAYLKIRQEQSGSAV